MALTKGMQISRGKAFQAKRIASTKAPKVGVCRTCSRSSKEASIVPPILKPHKERKIADQYPSLIYMQKTLNKKLAKQIQQPRTIYHDLVGFIPGKQEWFNTKKTVTAAHHINKQRKKRTTSNDREKTFDYIQCLFMI